MKRYAYLNRLEELLAGMPQRERQQALQYYEEYFKMAGAEQEEEVAARLGTPESLAERILQGQAESTARTGGGRARVLLAVLALLVVIGLTIGIGMLSKGWPPMTAQNAERAPSQAAALSDAEGQ